MPKDQTQEPALEFDNRVVVTIRQYRDLDSLTIFKSNMLAQQPELEKMLKEFNEHLAGFKENIPTDAPTYDRALVAMIIVHMSGQCRLSTPENPTEHKLEECTKAQFTNWIRHLLSVARQVDNPDSPLKKGTYKPFDLDYVTRVSMKRMTMIQDMVAQSEQSMSPAPAAEAGS